MHVDWLDSDVNRPMNSHGCQRSAPSTDEDPNPSARSSQVVRLLQSRGSTLSRIPAKTYIPGAQAVQLLLTSPTRAETNPGLHGRHCSSLEYCPAHVHRANGVTERCASVQHSKECDTR